MYLRQVGRRGDSDNIEQGVQEEAKQEEKEGWGRVSRGGRLQSYGRGVIFYC